MKFTVIGYWGAYPEKGSATSCYLLEKENFSLLIDCGSGALSRLPYYKELAELDAVILSHYHQDHIADIGVLQYSRLVENQLSGLDKQLPIYGHRENEEAFDKLDHHATKALAYDPDTLLEIGPFQVTFLKAVHPVPCYGMRITDGLHSIVYTADTSFSKEWIPFSKGADLLVAECSFYQSQDGSYAGHMNSKEAAEVAERSGANALILSHLPHFGNKQDLKKEAEQCYKGKVTLAVEGLSWQSD